MSKDFFKRQLEKIKLALSQDIQAVELVDKLLEKVENSPTEIWTDFLPNKSSDKLSAKKELSLLAKQAFAVPQELVAPNPLALTRFAVFCDGGCRGNPGPGAWATIGSTVDGTIMFELTGLDILTTNNKMELEGAIQGIQAIRQHVSMQGINNPIEIHLYCDSKYVLEGLEKWLPAWKARGWKKSDNKAPENMESWMRLDQVAQTPFRPFCHWVKGHDGHPQNEYCDELVNKALDEADF